MYIHAATPWTRRAKAHQTSHVVWLISEPGLLSNQGEKSINCYFIMVPLRKKVLKYGTPNPRSSGQRRTSHSLAEAIGWAAEVSGLGAWGCLGFRVSVGLFGN